VFFAGAPELPPGVEPSRQASKDRSSSSR